MVRNPNSIYIYEIDKKEPIIHLKFKDKFYKISNLFYFKE